MVALTELIGSGKGSGEEISLGACQSRLLTSVAAKLSRSVHCFLHDGSLLKFHLQRLSLATLELQRYQARTDFNRV
eukprot:2925464-Amphidinium_carterae.1